MNTLVYWLNLSKNYPPDWEHEIRRAWKKGVRRFGKVPASIPSVSLAEELNTQPVITGPVRPLLDPEPPAYGVEFFLTWHDGTGWHHRLPVCQVHAGGTDGNYTVNDLFRAGDQASAVAAKTRRSELLSSALSDHQLGKQTSSSLEEARRLVAEGSIEDALGIAFEAGARHGHASALQRMEPILRTHYKRDVSADWVEVAQGALIRHGVQLSPFEILARMGGTRVHEKVDLADGSNRDDDYWLFPGGAKIESAEFQKAHKQAKARIAQSQGKTTK